MHAVAVIGLLLVQFVLGAVSLSYDSVTFDELTHFTSGVSYWQHRDYRLDPENPPLVQLWSTLPLRLMNVPAVPTDTDAWRRGDQWNVARAWFGGQGERLLGYARLQMLFLLTAMSVAIYFVTRRLLGAGAALLALAVAALWPTLLAHGRLVTSDVPMALFSFVTIAGVAALLQRPGVARFALAATACAGLALAKFSAVLVAPALLAMWAVTAAGAAPGSRGRTALRNAGLLAGLLVSTWAAIWLAYGGRFTIFADDVAEIEKLPDADARLAVRRYWLQMLNDAAERRNSVWAPWIIERVEAARVLPEAYLYGFTYTLHSAQGRPAYLAGRYSETGWWYFFPAAFGLKTPIAIQLLLVAGAAALIIQRRELWRAHAVYLSGLAVFATVHLAMSLTSKLNIGERHLIPLYPIACVAIGAGALLMQKRWARVAGGLLIGWLAASTLTAFPHFLSYGNEIMGGQGRAHRWLADSSVDWGQGLYALNDYLENHSDEPVKLAYFGSADASVVWSSPADLKQRGMRVTALPSYRPFEPMAELTAGTYVISITQLVGVYDRVLRPESWTDPELVRAFAAWRQLAEGALPASANAAARAENEAARKTYAELRAKRLISQLRNRTPDFWIHPTLAAFRLTQDEIDRMTQVDDVPDQ